MASNIGYKKTLHFRKDKGEFAFNRCMRGCIGNARYRGLTFTLTSDQYRAIVTSPCHYCGYEGDSYNPYFKKDGSLGCFKTVNLEWAQKQWIRLNGIDRRDNSIGYEYGNCIPCCKTCNYAKHNQTYDNFTEYLERVKRFRSEN